MPKPFYDQLGDAEAARSMHVEARRIKAFQAFYQRMHWDFETMVSIGRKWEAGVSVREIAAAVQCSRRTISNFAKRLGLTKRIRDYSAMGRIGGAKQRETAKTRREEFIAQGRLFENRLKASISLEDTKAAVC